MRRLRRLALAITCLSLLIAVLPTSVGAFGGATGTIVTQSCTYNHPWYGSIIPTAAPGDKSYAWVRGTFDTCATVLKMSDSSSTYDWYTVETWIEWTATGGHNSWGDNHADLTISSSIASGAYTASPSVTSHSSCSSPISISVGMSYEGASLGITVKPEFCSGYSVTRTSYNGTSAKWGNTSTGWPNGDVQKTPRWEEAYQTRVGQGKHPVFKSDVRWPDYEPWFDYSAGQRVWKYTRYWGDTIEYLYT